jgi:hypothetical protein
MMIREGLAAAVTGVVMLCSLAPALAVAQAVKYLHLNKATIQGHRIQISYGLQANRDCSPNGYPSIKITTAPSHGRVSIERGRVIPSYPANNPRRRCNGTKLPAVVVFYTPSAAFTGRDFVETATSFINGEVAETKIDIDVE